jgi:hypothetical protein
MDFENTMKIDRMITVNDLVEITLENPDDFLKVKETLTRIGVASKETKQLWQSCHILHKKGKYYITHFKELFALDMRPTTLTESDIARRNKITALLVEWGLVKLVNPEQIKEPQAPINQIKIVPFKEKSEWQLLEKYNIGKRS